MTRIYKSFTFMDDPEGAAKCQRENPDAIRLVIVDPPRCEHKPCKSPDCNCPAMTLGNMRHLGAWLGASCVIGFLATIAFAAPAVVHGCDKLDSIANLVEPVKDFANNAIRIAHISTEEPAAAPDHLLIFVSVERRERFIVSVQSRDH